MAEPSLIERLRHELALIGMEYASQGKEREAATITTTLSTLEDQARLIGECRSVMVAVMQERRGYFGLVDALLTKLNAFGERDE